MDSIYSSSYKSFSSDGVLQECKRLPAIHEPQSTNNLSLPLSLSLSLPLSLSRSLPFSLSLSLPLSLSLSHSLFCAVDLSDSSKNKKTTCQLLARWSAIHEQSPPQSEDVLATVMYIGRLLQTIPPKNYRSLSHNIVSFIGLFCKRDVSFSGAYQYTLSQSEDVLATVIVRRQLSRPGLLCLFCR